MCELHKDHDVLDLNIKFHETEEKLSPDVRHQKQLIITNFKWFQVYFSIQYESIDDISVSSPRM